MVTVQFVQFAVLVCVHTYIGIISNHSIFINHLQINGCEEVGRYRKGSVGKNSIFLFLNPMSPESGSLGMLTRRGYKSEWD